MRKTIITIIILCVMLSGCSTQSYLWSQWTVSSSPPQSPDPNPVSYAINVGVSIQDETPYIEDLMRKLVREAKDIDANIIIRDGENSFEKQQSQVESFIASGVDIILLNPSSFDDCAPAVQAASDAGIPIVTFINPVSNQELCETFVGWNHIDKGSIIAEQMASDIGYSGDVAILQDTMDTDNQKNLLSGYENVLYKYENINVVATQSANLDRWQAMSIVQNWIENNIEFDAILAQSDTMALGAMDALRSSGLIEDVKVYGADGDYEALSSVLKGELAATVVQDANIHVDMLIKCIQKVYKNEGNPRTYDIPVTLVNSSNVIEYYYTLE